MAYTNDPASQSNQLPISIDLPEDNERLREILTNSYKRTADAVNYKIGGLFSLQEVADFERWFSSNSTTNTRNGFRKVFKFTGSDLTFPHDIPQLKQVTDYRAILYTSDKEWIKIPYVDVTDVTKQISMKVTETKIVIDVGAGFASTIKSGIAVIEYLKQD